jgi:hypothetical protein
MATKQAILRPIEFTTSNNSLVYVTNGTTYTATITAGVHANILSVCKALRTDMAAGSDNVTLYIDQNNKVTLTCATSVNPTHTAGWRILGFSGTESSGTTVTADYTPLYSWFPTYHSGDTDRFIKPSKDQFYGVAGIDGNLSGIAVESRAQRLIRWPAEFAKNTIPEANSTSYTDSDDGLVHYIEDERCFWTHLNGARTVAITASTSGNISPKGCYYINNWDTYTPVGGSAANWPAEGGWDSGGIKFEDASNSDNYVFCSVPEPLKRPDIFRDIHTTHYDCEAMLRTATAPTWTSGSAIVES